MSYFSSPARGEARRISAKPSRLRRETLLAQTRVYWYDPTTHAWFVGRVSEDGLIEGGYLGSNEDHYLIDLPNKQFARVPVSILQVRWDRPEDDPVAYLAARTTETPFWHIGRREFLRQAVEQRAVCGSMTGLWSAAIDLELHQFRAVRRVLTDPVQRYLLADEVGLGKTIEAGTILRQFVLDEPETHQAVVVVPEHLIAQWSTELTNRFYLGRHLNRSVHVVSEEDSSVALSAARGVGMLIVDEAHHVASMAFSPAEEERQRYVALADAARRIPRVLLLSATPILGNEDGFLAMLHLLDPQAYHLDDRAAFRHRVENRQQIAESLSDLQPDSPGLFVRDALDTLEALTPGDARALQLIAQVRAHVGSDETAPERQTAIRSLRDHIGEVYRLHQRLIRNRRENLRDVLHGRAGARVVSVHDSGRQRLAELLELWREHANLGAPPSPGGGKPVSGLYWLLLQAAASAPAVLQELVTARRFNRQPSPSLTPAVRQDLALLHMAEVFPRESEILDAVLAVDGIDESPRREAAVAVVRAGQVKRLKTVVFVDAPGVADALASSLDEALAGAVLRHIPGTSLDPFLETEGRAWALVCDRRAEEGLNLQSVRAQVLHFDLPLDPGRVEQRLGRVDRFGARTTAASFIFENEDPLLETWSHCLQKVVRVFERSVASLQYALDEQLSILRTTVFEGGVEAVEALMARLDDSTVGLEAELNRVRTQEQLDAISEASEAELEQFRAMDDADAEDERLQGSFEGWAVERLQFSREYEDPERKIVRYRYASGKARQTLLPPNQFARWCGESIDRQAGPHIRATRRMSFSRFRCQRRNAELARIGHPFVDGLVELARRDDRGVAHAMWRVRPQFRPPLDPWLAFGFDYLIEAEPDIVALDGADRASAAAVRRHLDTLLPPRYATVWIDQELEPIVEQRILAVLAERYDNRRTSTRGDWNLSAERWEVVRPLLRVGDWEQLCFDASQRAFAVMRDRLGLENELRRAERRVDERLAQVQALLHARLSRLSGTTNVAERHVLEAEETLAEVSRRAIRSPRVTPDSAFAVFLATSNPFSAHIR